MKSQEYYENLKKQYSIYIDHCYNVMMGKTQVHYNHKGVREAIIKFVEEYAYESLGHRYYCNVELKYSNTNFKYKKLTASTITLYRDNSKYVEFKEWLSKFYVCGIKGSESEILQFCIDFAMNSISELYEDNIYRHMQLGYYYQYQIDDICMNYVNKYLESIHGIYYDGRHTEFAEKLASSSHLEQSATRPLIAVFEGILTSAANDYVKNCNVNIDIELPLVFWYPSKYDELMQPIYRTLQITSGDKTNLYDFIRYPSGRMTLAAKKNDLGIHPDMHPELLFRLTNTLLKSIDILYSNIEKGLKDE